MYKLTVALFAIFASASAGLVPSGVSSVQRIQNYATIGAVGVPVAAVGKGVVGLGLGSGLGLGLGGGLGLGVASPVGLGVASGLGLGLGGLGVAKAGVPLVGVAAPLGGLGLKAGIAAPVALAPVGLKGAGLGLGLGLGGQLIGGQLIGAPLLGAGIIG